jgi:predicted transcriptional regulator
MKLPKKQIIKIAKQPEMTIRRLSLETGISTAKAQKILKEVKDANRHTKKLL